FRKRLCHVLERTEIDVVALAFLGQQRMEGVMKVVVPLSVEAVSAQVGRPDDARVVQRAFRDCVNSAVEGKGFIMDGLSGLFEEMESRSIVDCVDGIET